MKTLLVDVENKFKAKEEVRQFCTIIHTFVTINVIAIKIREEDIKKLDACDNVISYEESRKGMFEI